MTIPDTLAPRSAGSCHSKPCTNQGLTFRWSWVHRGVACISSYRDANSSWQRTLCRLSFVESRRRGWWYGAEAYHSTGRTPSADIASWKKLLKRCVYSDCSEYVSGPTVKRRYQGARSRRTTGRCRPGSAYARDFKCKL
jgi:hypothetical protein